MADKKENKDYCDAEDQKKVVDKNGRLRQEC